MPVTERRAQLIAATARVVSREGVAGATTRRIAEEAGAPLAALHYTFRDKEELFAAVIEDGLRRTAELIAERGTPPGSGLAAAVSDYLRTYRDWARADRDMMVAQYALFTWMMRSPAGREDAARAYRRYVDGLLPVLREAAAEGEHDVDLVRLARLAVAVADGMILQLVALGDEAMPGLEPEAISAGLVHAAR